MRGCYVVLVAACGVSSSSPQASSCDQWQQWGNGAAHEGRSCAVGQPLAGVLADLTIDPFVTAEQRDTLDLNIHYQVPLLDGDAVFVMEKRGTYTPCVHVADPMTQVKCYQPADATRFDSQVWAETRYDWIGGALVRGWSFESDWKPPPYNETMFQPALVGGQLAIPGAHGSLWMVDAATGEVVDHVEPFPPLFGISLDIRVAGAVATDGNGVYYNAVDAASGRGWLVAVAGSARVASYDALVPGAPRADDLCFWNYGTFGPLNTMSLPPSDTFGNVIPPPQYPCGAQVPGANAAPAIAADGTLYVATHAANNEYYSYIVAIDRATLQPRWSASLRDRLRDGCGLWVTCAQNAPIGVDPATGQLPAGLVDDGSSSSPVALPHGGVIYGALTYYNGLRGHLMAFDVHGAFTGSYDFGWDTTPAITSDGDRDLVVLKDNHYFNGLATAVGPYFITELDALTMQPRWQLANTEHRSCARLADGQLSCRDDHPNGFEWCVNAPAIDSAGTIYANSEDGNLYAITAEGTVASRVFLQEALGAAYTPLSIDHVGRIYSQNDGHLFVVGQPRVVTESPITRRSP